MRKNIVKKKKKVVTNVYMRDCLKYEILTKNYNNEYVITIKKFVEVIEPTTFSRDVFSYIVEITPLKENYNIRAFISESKDKVIGYYFDITYKNGIENMTPYYIDLYLDIVGSPQDNNYHFCDEDELLQAKEEKLISKIDYNLAYRVGEKLMEEIKSGTNKYLNLDVLKILQESNM